MKTSYLQKVAKSLSPTHVECNNAGLRLACRVCSAANENTKDIGMSVSLARKATKAVGTSFIAAILSGLLQAAILAVLSRILGPDEYGPFVLATVIVRLTMGMVTGSLERALAIGPDETFTPRVFLPVSLVVLIASLLIGSATYLLNWLPGWREHLQISLFLIVLFSNAVGALAIVPRVALRRQMSYGAIAAVELTAQFLGLGLATIWAAAEGWGSKSLAFGMLVQGVTSCALFIIVGRTHLSVNFHPHALSAFVRPTFEIAKSSGLEIVYGQLPALMIGRNVGAAAVGLFNRGYSLVQLPIELLTTSVSRALLSGLVAIRSDQERLTRAYRLLVTTTVCMISPVASGMSVSHNELVYVVLGSKWQEAASLIPLLALYTWTSMTGHLFAILAEATGALKRKVTIQAVSTTAMIIGLLVGSFWGLPGAILGMCFSGSVFLGLYMWNGAQILGTRFASILRWFLPGIGGGVASGMAGWLVGTVLKDWSTYQIFVFQVLGCGAATGTYYLIFHRKVLLEILLKVGLKSPFGSKVD